MSGFDLGARARGVVGRLAALDYSAVNIDRRVIEGALEGYLRALGLPRRPLRWADDAQSGIAVALRGTFAGAHSTAGWDAFVKSRGLPVPTARPAWNLGLRAAREAARAQVWERVTGAVRREVGQRLYEFSAAGNYTGQQREALRHKFSVWCAATDVVRTIPLVAADHASYYTFGDPARVERNAELWGPFVDACEAGLWLFWVTEEATVVVPRPTIHVEGTGASARLHSDAGAAVHFPTGERYYFLHGVKVGAEIVETPAGVLDPRLILTERNAEVRREIVRKIGLERVCEALGARCVERRGDYELLLLDLRDGAPRPFLKMRNPSIGVYHVEGVAPECRTVAQALAWRNRTKRPPAILT